MKTALKWMGLLVFSAGLGILPAATRSDACRQDNNYNRTYTAARDNSYRNSAAGRYDEHDGRADRDRHDRRGRDARYEWSSYRSDCR